MILYHPYFVRFSALGTQLLGECAMANGLGHRNPRKLLVGFSEQNEQFYMMPVHHEHILGIDCAYNRDGVAAFSLMDVFAPEGIMAQRGYRHIYPLWMTDEKWPIHGVLGYCLFIEMGQYDRRALQSKR